MMTRFYLDLVDYSLNILSGGSMPYTSTQQVTFYVQKPIFEPQSYYIR